MIAERFHEPAHAHTISLKSALLTEAVHAVIVLAVQIVFDSTKRRFVTEFPFNVNVPVTIWSADSVNVFVLVAVPVRVRVVNVFAHEKVLAAQLITAVSYVSHHPAKLHEQTIVDDA